MAQERTGKGWFLALGAVLWWPEDGFHISSVNQTLQAKPLEKVWPSLHLCLVNPSRKDKLAEASQSPAYEGKNDTDGSPKHHLPPHVPPQSLSFPLSPSVLCLKSYCSRGKDVCPSWEIATEQCVTVPSARPLYLLPAPLAASQELGPEQHGSQAQGLLAAGTQVRGLDLVLGSQGIA